MSRGPSYGLPSCWAGPPGDAEGQEQGDVLCPSCRVSDGFFFFLVGESQKRAVKAENHVLKLRQEVSLLQVTSKRASPVRV